MQYPEFKAPLSFVETNEFPIYLSTAAGVKDAGVLFNDAGMTVTVRGPNDTTGAAFVMATANWEEIGDGWYLFKLRGSVAAEAAHCRRTGRLVVTVACTASSGTGIYNLAPGRALTVLDMEPVTRYRPWAQYPQPLFDIEYLTAQGAPTGYSGKLKSAWSNAGGTAYEAWVMLKSGSQEQVHRFTSTDCLDWTWDAASGSIFTSSAAPSWEGSANSGFGMFGVWYDDVTAQYEALYRGGTGTVAYPFAIGHATSPDGIVWTKDATNPVIEGSTDPTDWDYLSIEPGAQTIRVAGTYYHYYSAYTAPAAEVVTAPGYYTWNRRAIGVATAAAPGGPWTRQAGPLFSGGCFGAAPFAATTNGQTRYYLLFSHYTVGNDKSRHELWSSPSPLFPKSARRFERVVGTSDYGFAGMDMDTVSTVHSSIERASFPGSKMFVFYTGSNDPAETTMSGNRTGLYYGNRPASDLLGTRTDIAATVWGRPDVTLEDTSAPPNPDLDPRTVEFAPDAPYALSAITTDAQGRITGATKTYTGPYGETLATRTMTATYTGNSQVPTTYTEA